MMLDDGDRPNRVSAVSGTPLSRPEPGMEVLREPQCRELLATQQIGRIAFSAGFGIEIFPVTYVADGIVVVFRSGPGSKLEHAFGSRVSFEVDCWDPVARVGWSVVLKGVAQDVTGGTDPASQRLLASGVIPLAPGRRDHWVAVFPSEVSGRRFRLG